MMQVKSMASILVGLETTHVIRKIILKLKGAKVADVEQLMRILELLRAVDPELLK
jgi:hypothetical protein